MTVKPVSDAASTPELPAVQPSPIVSFLIYFVPVLGWLVGLFFLRRNIVAFYHACQALALTLGALLIPLLWAVAGWGIAWIPLVGPVTAIAAFALVIAGAVAVIVAWIMGLVNALRGKTVPVPIFGGWGERIFLRLVRPPAGVAVVVKAEEEVDADLDVEL